MTFYTREAIRRARQVAEPGEPEKERSYETSAMADVPADAPMDDATVTVWNGQRFVAYEKWLATAPIAREVERREETEHAIPADAACVTADCGRTRVWLVRDGERWLMFAGSRKASGRRRDFASPFLAHAIRTAEQWYGAPSGAWRPETKTDGKDVRKTASVSPQDHGLAEEACG